MYLKLEKNLYEAEMTKLSKWVLRILKYLSEHEKIKMEKMIDSLGPDGEWLKHRRSDSKVIQDIKKLALETQHSRKEIYEAVRHDMEFAGHYDDSSFEFEEKKLKKQQFDKLKAFIGDLYGAFSGGKGIDCDAVSIHYRKLREGIFDANSLELCPVCLKREYIFSEDSEVDHYFPKSRYPALAFHATNLAPICKNCNGLKRKGEKDPLSEGDLTELYVPYCRAAKEETKISVTGLGGGRKVEMIPLKSGGSVEKRIGHMDELYGLSGRWSREIQYYFKYCLRKALNLPGKVEVEQWLEENAEEKRQFSEDNPELLIESACCMFLAREGKNAFMEEWEKQRLKPDVLAK